ncbi:hypothetical protein [Actinomadura sp. 6N118]|uniref:hypothetical protein n=1 Tax=Actinomadura sp. 6N118 TaxID=3375151 RepID=UPI0037A377D5
MAAAMFCGTAVAHANPQAPIGRTWASAINNGGVAVGSSSERAVRWETDGRITVLNGLYEPAGAYANEVNESGVVVGDSDVEHTVNFHAVRWSASGQLTDLEPGSYDLSSASDVNASGDAVGWTWHDGEALRWSLNGQRTVLPLLPGGDSGGGWGINDDGYMTGWSDDGAGTRGRAVRWAPDGTVTRLGAVPGEEASWGGDINGSGTVVGTVTISGQTQAVRWSPNGAPTMLGTLPGHVAASPYRINSGGVAVGTSTAADGTGKAVRWDANGTITALPLLLGSTHSNAVGINSAGVIVGDVTINGVPHAVRWNTDGTVVDLGGLPPRSARAAARGQSPSCFTGPRLPGTCPKHALLP